MTRDDPGERHRPCFLVDPAPDAGAPLGGERERGSRDEARHAGNAWSARTSEFPYRIWSTSAAFGAPVTPGIESGVGSGRATEAMIQTTPSSAMATARPPPIQLRSAGHGSPFNRASEPRVSRAPCTSTYWFTSTA